MNTPIAIMLFDGGKGTLAVLQAEHFRGRRPDAIIWMRTPTLREWQIVEPVLAARPEIKQFTAAEGNQLPCKG